MEFRASYHGFVDSFEWHFGKTGGSSLPFLATSIVGYLTVIFSLQLLLRQRKTAVPLGSLPAIHNLILCLGSLIMFLGALEATISSSLLWLREGTSKSTYRTAETGYRWLLCFPNDTLPRGRIFFWSYIYYLSKFYELLDTVILVLKKKPLSFLHVYHHSFVVIMCWLWLQYSQSLQTIGLLTNTGIHVIMYWYYFMHSIGHPPPWRKFVTNGQIVQFLFSFTVSIPFFYLHVKESCAGFYAWLFNASFNFTLLLLFFNFHRKQYSRRTKEIAKKGD